MLRQSTARFGGRFQYNLKYPSLVSYNKLPWEILSPDTPKLHAHVAPHYVQILTLAASTQIPHLAQPHHLVVPEEKQGHVLPGLVYVVSKKSPTAAVEPPTGWNVSRTVNDPFSMQYYGALNRDIASVQGVTMFSSPDLRLLCNAVDFSNVQIPVTPNSTLDAVLNGTQTGKSSSSSFVMYHFFRPNRPPTEISRPLEKFYVHVPQLESMQALVSSDNWRPVLQTPRRAEGKTRASPMPKYQPPTSYLMGLAERLAVRPGDSFGKRSLMWGHWF